MNKLPRIIGSIFLLLAGSVMAAEDAVKKAPQLADNDLAGNLIQTTLGLLVILLMIGAAAWLMKRYGNLKVGAQGRMKIVGGLSVGTRERIVLLEVGKQQLVIGIAPGHIRTLHVLDEPIPAETPEVQRGGFADRLQAVLKGEQVSDKVVK